MTSPEKHKQAHSFTETFTESISSNTEKMKNLNNFILDFINHLNQNQNNNQHCQQFSPSHTNEYDEFIRTPTKSNIEHLPISQKTCTSKNISDLLNLLNIQERQVDKLVQATADAFTIFLEIHYSSCKSQKKPQIPPTVCLKQFDKGKSGQPKESPTRTCTVGDSSECNVGKILNPDLTITDSGLNDSMSVCLSGSTSNVSIPDTILKTDYQQNLKKDGFETQNLLVDMDPANLWKARAHACREKLNQAKIDFEKLRKENLDLKAGNKVNKNLKKSQKITNDQFQDDSPNRELDQLIASKNELNNMMKDLKSTNKSIDAENEILKFKIELSENECFEEKMKVNELSRELKELKIRVAPIMEFVDETF